MRRCRSLATEPLPGAMPPAAAEIILAYRAESSIEARALAAHLESAGIEARVCGDSYEGGFTGIPSLKPIQVEVWIAAADRAAVEPLVAAWEAEHHPHRAAAAGQRFQFSMAAMLATMTAVVLLAASVGREAEAFS